MKTDLQLAVKVNPQDSKGYYLRSDFWRTPDPKYRDIESSIHDLIAAVKLDKKPKADSYVRIGNYYLQKKDFEQAYNNFKEARRINPNTDNWLMGIFLYIYTALAVFNNKKKREICLECMPVIKLIDNIKFNYFDPIWSDSKPVVHFTKLSVADILFSSDSNKLRFYHSSFMNDMEEGKIFLQILNDPGITSAFGNAELFIENNFYLGSFLPNSHRDYLIMWRLYGKDENSAEAKGCSLVINRDFFENRKEKELPDEDEGNGSSQSKQHDSENRTRFDQTLHKVMYFDRDKNKIVDDDGNNLKKDLLKLKNMLKIILEYKNADRPPSDKINRAIDKIIYTFLTELRFFFKSADFAYENEERVICSVPSSSNLVKIDDRDTMPKRHYIESKGKVRRHIKKIILGPRVARPDQYSYLKVKMIKDMPHFEMRKSERRFQ